MDGAHNNNTGGRYCCDDYQRDFDVRDIYPTILLIVVDVPIAAVIVDVTVLVLGGEMVLEDVTPSEDCHHFLVDHPSLTSVR